MRAWLRAESGFSLIDQLATLAIVATVTGIAVPALVNSVENQRLGIEVRNVERELQLARLAAVTTNRPIRMRFDCPATGYYRRVELIGSVNDPSNGDDSDSQGNRRCSLTNYPFPAADRDPLTRPNYDGPLHKLNQSVAFISQQTLEFWPNGTVHVATGAVGGQTWPQIGAMPLTLTLRKSSTDKTITVNSLGKIRIQ